jgi:hypothetical protein
LLEHPGLLVTKQQVLDAVWPGTFVGDGVLKDNIRQLREALEDDAESPIYIETAHRRGYRFIGKLIEPVPNQGPGTAAQEPNFQLAPNGPEPTSSAIANGFLGRDPELARMRGWLKRAVAGERQTIFITGEPRIGKTTIVQVFLEQAVQIPSLRVARGQCLEQYGAAEAYLPVLDAFTRLCRSRARAQVLEVLRQDVVQLYQVLAGLEGMAGYLAAAAGADVANLQSIVQDMRDASDARDSKVLTDCDLRFHLELCRISGNSHLFSYAQKILRPLFAFVRMRVSVSGQGTSAWGQDVDAHQRIIDLIREGEAELAEVHGPLRIHGSQELDTA